MLLFLLLRGFGRSLAPFLCFSIATLNLNGQLLFGIIGIETMTIVIEEHSIVLVVVRILAQILAEVDLTWSLAYGQLLIWRLVPRVDEWRRVVDRFALQALLPDVHPSSLIGVIIYDVLHRAVLDLGNSWHFAEALFVGDESMQYIHTFVHGDRVVTNAKVMVVVDARPII